MSLTLAKFRALALALPDAIESQHQGHPDFRAGGKVFASLWPDGKHAMVRLTPERQAELCASNPAACAPAKGAWGARGCTILTLSKTTPTLAKGVLAEAWRNATGQ